MAYSYVRYTGNGSTTNYTFSFPTISTDHIKVRVNGTLVTNWSFLSASTIQFAAAPANAAVIEIRRETPKDSSIVNFTDGSVLLERDLDLLATWQLYVAQETEDDLEDTIRVDSLGRFDALNKRIINVTDPVAAQDAVTKNWLETTYTSELDAIALAAASSATAADTSATNAASSASAAAASYDSFDDRYLGAKSAAPTTDNDGQALITGTIYWDTPSSQMFTWNGTSWRPTFLIGNTVRTVVTATAGQTVVSAPTYLVGSNTLQVFVNGVKVLQGADYTETTQNSITFASGLATGDEVELIAQQAFAVDELRTDLASAAAGKGSSLVSYLPAGTGAVVTTVQSKLRTLVGRNDYTNDTDYDTARNALSGRNDLVVRPTVETTDLLLSNALDQTRAALTKGRTAPHANFNWFTSDFTVTTCAGPGRASVLQDLRDVWTTKYSGLMTGGIVYVDGTNGNDANAGTITAPWATIDKAIRTSNSGMVYVMPGNYESTGFRYTDTQGDRPKMVIAPYGGVTIRVSGDTVSSATWTANGTYPNVYETTLVSANYVIRVLRTDRTDALGLPTPMPKCASLADVNTQGYGWWYDSATKKLYVRDGVLNINTAVKASLQAVYATAGDNQLLVYSAKLYLENITLLQYPNVLKLAGQAVPEVWLKNCAVRYAESTSRLVSGGGAYSQGSIYYRSAADHANYTTASSTTAYGVEINDTTYFAGDVDTFGSGATQPNNPISTGQNKNSSSNHSGYVVRINGIHSGSFGPVIADTDTSYTWNLGTQAGYSYATGTSRYGFIVQGSTARAWLDGCSTTGNSGFNSDTSAAISIFNCAGPQVTTNSGTFTKYVPA